MLAKLFGLVDKYPAVGRSNEANRVAWLEKTLKKIPDGTRLLDAGAGEQQFRKFCGHLVYVSQDFAQYKPAEASIGLQMGAWDYSNIDIVSDIAAIPEPDESFDTILCTEVFEHVINPREALHEFSRLLKPGGNLIITAPFNSLTHFAPYHFYSGFSRFFYETELKKNDFEIVELTPNGNYFDFLAQEIRRSGSVARTYGAEYGLSRLERYAIQKFLNRLGKLSGNDRGSSELLCYGYHLWARKK